MFMADCRGPGSAPEPYARFEYGTTYPKSYRVGVRREPKEFGTLVPGPGEVMGSCSTTKLCTVPI